MAAAMKATYLRCEYRQNPLGIDVPQPRLSWIVEGNGRGLGQSAYRVLVASSPDLLAKDKADLWDSGKVASSQTVHIIYSGKTLASRARCFWKVRAWDRDGKETAWSKPASWTMGLLKKSDWKGKWVAMETELLKRLSGVSDLAKQTPPPPYLRKGFEVKKKVVRATLYATARGLFEVEINGKAVSADIFAPEWTDYFRRIQYRTYDVTKLLAKGGNAIGAVLGDGWYAGYVGWQKTRGRYGLQTSFMGQLEIDYADGSKETVATDRTWKTTLGPIRSSDFMAGERYDARLELPGWSKGSFDDSGWPGVEVVQTPDVPLVWQASEPVLVTKELAPVKMTQPARGVYVFDIGQNIAGFVRLKVSAPIGTAVQIRHAERLNPDGTIYTENLRRAKATDAYICKGKGVETYRPRFTFHGFQYVEITGLPSRPDKDTVTALAINSATPPAGSFECSNKLINRLYKNITWGQRGNFLSVPTDCPQRDERLGWMGDAEVFIETASRNMDVAAFFTKWMVDVEDAQDEEGRFPDIAPRLREDVNFVGLDKLRASAAWADAGVIVPWTVYRNYADTRIIERHWAAMTRWMEWLERVNPQYHRVNELSNNYGDWLCIPADESFGTTSPMKELLATAFWAFDAKCMAEMAAALMNKGQVSHYHDLFEKIRAKFQQVYVQAGGRLSVETQTAYLLALAFDLLNREDRRPAAVRLVELLKENGWHLSTGFVGIRLLNPVLTEMGYADVAYRLLNNRTYPSWLYPVTHGATTIWERWDGWTTEKGFGDAGMNSFNHYSLGSVGQWLFSDVAGISADKSAAGYERIVIKPYVGGGLKFARASYRSMRGTISTSWKLNGEKLTLDVTIPANTMALMYVPATDKLQVTEGGRLPAHCKCLTFLRYESGFAVFIAGSGRYSFRSVTRPIVPVE
jgi:alpha-L-rhamnosidase